MYTFLTPTGTIDDTDNHPSEEEDKTPTKESVEAIIKAATEASTLKDWWPWIKKLDLVDIATVKGKSLSANAHCDATIEDTY